MQRLNIRIVCYPPTGEDFLGNSGAIVNIPITASENIVNGIHEVKVDNQELTDNTGTKAYYPEAYTTTVEVSGGIDSDDGIVGIDYNSTEHTIYNLWGQKLEEIQHGINIVNDKKVLMK